MSTKRRWLRWKRQIRSTLLWPARCGYRVVEVPIEYQERVGVSKLRKLAGTVWTFIRLARTLGVGGRRQDTYEVWRDLEG